MAVIKTEAAIGNWDDRAELNYIPCNDYIPNVGLTDAFGRLSGAYNYGQDIVRRPYLVETAEGVTYVKYDSGISPIFRITEEE